MGWQDRDYARPIGGRGGSFGMPPGGRMMPMGFGRDIVTTLIIINVAVFVVENLVPALGGLIYAYGALRTDLVIKHGFIWQLFTAQYLHAGIGHLLFNMLALYYLGGMVARLWSPRRFFAVYTVCGLAGNLFYVLLGQSGYIHPAMPAVGASGCIYGLLGIAAVMFPRDTLYIYGIFPVRIRTLAIVLGFVAFFVVQTRGSNYGGQACHLAGLVFGIWWAARGDHWWNTTTWRLPRFLSSRKGGSPHRSSFTKKVQQRRVDQETIDNILRKVHDVGLHSLTEAEKRLLTEASERQQKRDDAAGRVDRL